MMQSVDLCFWTKNKRNLCGKTSWKNQVEICQNGETRRQNMVDMILLLIYLAPLSNDEASNRTGVSEGVRCY